MERAKEIVLLNTGGSIKSMGRNAGTQASRKRAGSGHIHASYIADVQWILT